MRAVANTSSFQEGGDGIQAARLKSLMRAEDLAVTVVRSLVCRAGTCAGGRGA